MAETRSGTNSRRNDTRTAAQNRNGPHAASKNQHRSNSPRYSDRYGANRPNPYTGYLPSGARADNLYHPESIDYAKAGRMASDNAAVAEAEKLRAAEAEKLRAAEAEKLRAAETEKQKAQAQTVKKARPAENQAAPSEAAKEAERRMPARQRQPKKTEEQKRAEQIEREKRMAEISRSVAAKTVAETLSDTITEAARPGLEAERTAARAGSNIRIGENGQPEVELPIIGEDGSVKNVWMPVNVPENSHVMDTKIKLSERPEKSGHSEEPELEQFAADGRKLSNENKFSAVSRKISEKAERAAENARRAEEAKKAEQKMLEAEKERLEAEAALKAQKAREAAEKAKIEAAGADAAEKARKAKEAAKNAAQAAAKIAAAEVIGGTQQDDPDDTDTDIGDDILQSTAEAAAPDAGEPDGIVFLDPDEEDGGDEDEDAGGADEDYGGGDDDDDDDDDEDEEEDDDDDDDDDEDEEEDDEDIEEEDEDEEEGDEDEEEEEDEDEEEDEEEDDEEDEDEDEDEEDEDEDEEEEDEEEDEDEEPEPVKPERAEQGNKKPVPESGAKQPQKRPAQPPAKAPQGQLRPQRPAGEQSRHQKGLDSRAGSEPAGSRVSSRYLLPSYTRAVSREQDDTLFIKRERTGSNTTVFDLPEGLKLPAYINDDEFLDQWLNEGDDMTSAERRRKRRASAAIGALVTLFAAIGFIIVLKFTLGAVTNLGQRTNVEDEYKEAVTPVVMSEVPAFEKWDTIPKDKLLQSAIFNILLNLEENEYDLDDTNKLKIPSTDVIKSARRLYGDEVTIDSEALTALDGEDVYYSDTDDSFHIAATGINGPQFVIVKQSKRAETVSLRLGYLEETASPDSTDYYQELVFVLEPDEDNFRITAIRIPESE